MLILVEAMNGEDCCIRCVARSTRTGAWTLLNIFPVFLGILSCIWIFWHSFLPVLLIFSLLTSRQCPQDLMTDTQSSQIWAASRPSRCRTDQLHHGAASRKRQPP